MAGVLGFYVLLNCVAMSSIPWAREEDGSMAFNSGMWVVLVESLKLVASLVMGRNDGSIDLGDLKSLFTVTVAPRERPCVWLGRGRGSCALCV